jgi:deoxycytidylate deaminase
MAIPMAFRFSRIEYPELFFGFVAPIGADLAPIRQEFRQYLEQQNYVVVDIKVTDLFDRLVSVVTPDKPLEKGEVYERFCTFISYGNQLRAHFKDDAILAMAAVEEIIRKRNEITAKAKTPTLERTAFLIHQFKRKEEVEFLRGIYGRLFFQISAYSRRGARVDTLARRIANSKDAAHPEQFRNKAEELVQRDADESGVVHGQRVSKIFHDADFIINLDLRKPPLSDQIHRFLEILFSSNACSPTHVEYGMFNAKAAALRTLDLSRQVGAAIFSQLGEVVSLGSNEVPKAGGGTYWSDEQFDARDFRMGSDSNFERKSQIFSDLMERVGLKDEADALLQRPEVRDSQFMDALEYGRMVHAEMCAISDAARLGRQIKDGVLYTTTFPCHLCAKHIVAAGISKVWFLEPYPKSLAADLHPDSIQIENSDRGQFADFPAVSFEHFFGVTPRRYRELFERGSRKDESGKFEPYVNGRKIPLIDIKLPFYLNFENEVLLAVKELFYSIGNAAKAQESPRRRSMARSKSSRRER